MSLFRIRTGLIYLINLGCDFTSLCSVLYQKRVIFLLTLPTCSSDFTASLAVSISVINEVCVVSRSATWALKLDLFPELWALSVSQAPYITQSLLANKNYISLLGFCHLSAISRKLHF